MAPEPPPAAAELRRSSRRRVKSAATREAEAEEEGVKVDEIDRAVPRKRQRRASKEEEPGAGKEAAADGEEKDVGFDGETEARARPRGKRQRGATGEPGPARKKAAKEKPKRKAKAQARGRAEVNGDGGETGGADDDDMCAEEPDAEEMEEVAAALEAEMDNAEGGEGSADKAAARKRVARPRNERNADASADHFVGEPLPDDEARRRWPERYSTKKGSESLSKRSDEEEDLKAQCHYNAANVDGAIFYIHDDVYVKAGLDEENYIGRITEFFEGVDHGSYFSCQWFYRTADTVISQKFLKMHDHKRVFLSMEKNENLIECIVSKVKIVHVDPNMAPQTKAQAISDCDFYYDMSYSVAYSTFANLPADNDAASGSEATSNISCDDVVDSSKGKPLVDTETPFNAQTKTSILLDLYSGCGAMSTGLCLGFGLSGINLENRWAVDMNKYACASLKHNHPSSMVRNEKAEHFLSLLREWDTLCKKYVVHENNMDLDLDNSPEDDDEVLPEDIFEVEKLLEVCYGNPNSIGKVGLWFKVRWKGYDSSFDTWEPIDGLSCCPGRIKEFVVNGYKDNILPLPGTVDVICGGPPCQGISGFNRFRNHENPLKDEKNKQLVVFMDIVEYLRPKYILMENVVDLLKFSDGFLGCYALSRLVAMNYQARLGMLAAGCYGLPQFRMRAFLWGALPSMVLPKFPLPTHDVVMRGVVPNAFSRSVVAYDATEVPCLKKALILEDAISDLPEVGNVQPKDVMDYSIEPDTEFQRHIRLSLKDEAKLFDHQPLKLNDDDYQRVQRIPVEKGANFRHLKGVKVGANNTVEWDPNIPRVLLPSGKPLVPDYAMSFVKGKSSKPFGRLWWDETIPTVVTRAEPHNQAILHPSQPRVLTIRENARLQGFPDYYRLLGPIKEKYIQVGNAVAVPVARALGYSLGLAYQGEHDGDQPLFKLPESFISINQAGMKSPGGEVVEESEQLPE